MFKSMQINSEAISPINSSRNTEIDILRGIGITAIVIGHASWDITFGDMTFHIGRFVYLFHVQLFFFIGGLLLKEKCFQDPWAYLGKRFQSLYVPFLKYSFILLLVSPLLSWMGMFPRHNEIMYYLLQFCNLFLFMGWGEIHSATWFLPVYFISIAAICLILSKLRFQKIFCAVMISGIGMLGGFLILNGCQFTYRLEVAFLMLPIVFIGFIFSPHLSKIKVLFPFESILIGGCLYALMSINNWYIDTSLGMILSSPFLFWLVSFCGCFFCLILSKEISRTHLAKIFVLIGQNSFCIMAFHLLVSKMIDFIYVSFGGSKEWLTAFPRGPQKLFIIYWTANIFIPIFLFKSYKALKSLFYNLFRNKKQKI